MPKIVVDTDELYTVEETQAKLGIGYATVFRWIKSGRLQALKVGGRTLIPKSEVKRINTNREKANPPAPVGSDELLPKDEGQHDPQ